MGPPPQYVTMAGYFISWGQLASFYKPAQCGEFSSPACCLPSRTQQMSLPPIEICTRTKLSRQKKHTQKTKQKTQPLKEEFLCCEWFILRIGLREVLEIFIQ